MNGSGPLHGPALQIAVPVAGRAWHGIVWHHSATVDGVARDWDGIRRYHMSYRIDGTIVSAEEFASRQALGHGVRFEKPWRDIGYHGGVERVGVNLQLCWGRPLSMLGAHAGVAGVPNGNRFNEQSIGLCAVGAFDAAPPGPDLWDYCLQFTRAVMLAYNIPAAAVLGHREVYAELGVPEQKSCPGRQWNMRLFREAL